MDYQTLEPRFPQHIALSFSGGGFRAASFALGCLSYMNKLTMSGDQPFIDLVHFISSASGGSFTNLFYAYSRSQQSWNFETFYRKMKEGILEGDRVTERALEILKSSEAWENTPEKSRNLINAFSKAYDELLFEGATFGLLNSSSKPIPFEICVNTTEFDNGMLFRFQNGGKVGNKFLKFKSDAISKEVLNRVKLSDILACSSCFPVGFEPFIFPKDFSYSRIASGQSLSLKSGELVTALVSDTTFSPEKSQQPSGTGARKALEFGIMDGGIDDNQGIGSFLLAEDRLMNRNGFGFDLYISCDVSSNYTSGYDFPKENMASWWQRPSMMQYSITAVVLALLGVLGIATGTLVSLSHVVFGVCLPFLCLIILGFWQSYQLLAGIRKSNNTYGLVFFRHFWFFLNLPIKSLLQAVDSRATSAAYLAAVVFLKKIRRISYDLLFSRITERKLDATRAPLRPGSDPALAAIIEVKQMRKFCLQNAVYLLSPKNDAQRMKDLQSEPWFDAGWQVSVDGSNQLLSTLMQPSDSIQNVARIATEMDTTLWYDTNQRSTGSPDALIQAGQFTTCYNLLRYALRFSRNDPFWAPLQEQLAEDWSKFRDNPGWLHADLIPKKIL
ncbi:patatin-like phospholipase family protein [Dyadobacter sp. CY261]|uniref:patatin-like phospholipase family protein n=1 Tax=Dyadobacter sp. CY261 TaxID=2907203 RepID=UPI001F3B4AE2|nr:patatin-like phospholipase family protein [Dyadobacter sp. CY261]MCF0069780.1 patatin-like phospholipase family protein [Dyadobacter sp. CY261]